MCRASEIRDRLNLKAVACVFDQSFYGRIGRCLNTYHNDGWFLFDNDVARCNRTRFGDAGLRELAIESDAIAEESIEGD